MENVTSMFLKNVQENKVMAPIAYTLQAHYNTDFGVHSDSEISVITECYEELTHRKYKQWEPYLNQARVCYSQIHAINDHVIL